MLRFCLYCIIEHYYVCEYIYIYIYPNTQRREGNRGMEIVTMMRD